MRRLSGDWVSTTTRTVHPHPTPAQELDTPDPNPDPDPNPNPNPNSKVLVKYIDGDWKWHKLWQEAIREVKLKQPKLPKPPPGSSTVQASPRGTPSTKLPSVSRPPAAHSTPG